MYINTAMPKAARAQSRIKSCQFCRQQRMRCDRVTRAPAPCTPCWKRGLDCAFSHASPEDHDPEIEQEALPAAPPRPTHAASHTALESSPDIDLHLYHGDNITARDGELVLTPPAINEYFQWFFNHLHPHFPFLPSPFSIPRTATTSPLLFWTITTIAAAHLNRPLYRPLQRHVRTLIADILYPSGHGLQSCQALCLVCLWPFEAEEPNDDPSYLYAGLVSHLALRLGLHRPEFSHEYNDIDKLTNPHGHDTQERWRTWCACQFVEHMLASKVGVPSGVRLVWPLRSKLYDLDSTPGPAISSTIKHHLLICDLRDRYIPSIAFEGRTMSGLVPPQDRVDRLKLFNAAMDDFEASVDSSLDTPSLIFLNMTRMTAAGFCFASDLQNSFSNDMQTMIVSGLHAAVSILDLVAPLAWETLPVHLLRAVLYAGVYAGQLQRVTPALALSIRPASLLERATDILRHLAFGNDFATRGKIVLETELTRMSHQPESSKGVTFQVRMEANMYWDLVEGKKAKHNWDQNADDIRRELLSSSGLDVASSGLR